MRSSLACGMAGALMLGTAGLVAYGWRGELAGAVIGAAVGLPCWARIDTWRLSRRAKNPQSRISRVLNWVLEGPIGAAELGAYLGALRVTVGATASPQWLRCSPR